MKKILYIVILSGILPLNVWAQVGYVGIEDEIYEYLNRMQTIEVISNYNSFELPKTRNEIKSYLVQIINNYEKLDRIDKNKLADFVAEFEFDLVSTLQKSETLVPSLNLNYLFSENEKYIYTYHNNNGTSIFLNFLGKADYLHLSDIANKVNANSTLYRFGGNFRGSFYNIIGFEINTTNGSFFGNKDLAKSFSSLKYNYKFNRTTSSDLGDNFFDETSTYLTLENSYLKLKIGNDRKLIGHGINKVILSDNAPRMDYISLNLNYEAFNFSFFHGKLLGMQTVNLDPIQGNINLVNDKYLAYHRFGFNPSRHLNLGLGEMIIYANRNIDFAYLNPFNFYKSAEHANQDRDNTFLFFDLQNNSFNKLKLYSTILIDDIDFGKIGKGWYGNQTLLSIGAYSSQLYYLIPLDLELQYIKIDPYVFSHRIYDNNFTNSNFNLGSVLEPNSSSTSINIYYRPHYRVNINLGFSYTIHGANTISDNGEIINYGGDINLGHRVNDSEEVYFLQGEKEIFREYHLKTEIEPIKSWIFSLVLNYSNKTLARSQYPQELFSTFSLYIKL
jgi:hypothetical protein